MDAYVENTLDIEKATRQKHAEVVDKSVIDEVVKRMDKNEFEKEVEKISEHGASMGKIFELKNIVHGKPKQQRQVPAAVQDCNGIFILTHYLQRNLIKLSNWHILRYFVKTR